jgi:NADH-quinone oxidoreductase subunit G
MEITTYLERAMTSELQGNVIDLCPVGALTSKPYAFQARPWELIKTETIDAMDAVGSNIRVDTRGREVMRILPRLHEGINEEWISDKTRFVWDGLRTQRLDRPYVRSRGKLDPASWREAFAAIAKVLKNVPGERIGAIAGDLATAEEMYALKALMNSLGSANIDCRQDGTALEPAFGRASYLFNPSITGIEDADALLIIGSDPRHEAPLVNARIRKRWRMGDLPVALIGEKVDLTYPYQHLGRGTAAVAELAAGKGAFAETLGKAKRPIVLVGQNALARPEGMAILREAARIATAGDHDPGWNGLGVLHTAAGRVGGLDVGFVPGSRGLEVAGMIEAAGAGRLDVLFLLGADEIDTAALGNAFVVYIGSHGDAGAHRADVILPGAAYTEKHGTLVNTEGRVQRLKRAAFPPGDAREDWAILRALSDVLGHTLPFDSIGALQAKMFADNPHLAKADHVAMDAPEALEPLFAVKGTIGSEPFGAAIADFYLTNPIARASAVMAECSALAAGRLADAAE